MGLPYNVNLVDINKGAQFDPAFSAISSNDRIPTAIDPYGPQRATTSIFESEAILQYLSRNTGKLCGTIEHDRISTVQWLMWQMGGLGPMAGQAYHFLKYAQK
ncbi:MAG: GST-like protein [Paracoccaceae bacterium]|jgi:GST-like protein